MPKSESEQIIESEVEDVLALQKQVDEAQAALMKLPEFMKFTQMQKEINAQTAAVWKNIEQQMIEKNVKSIKGDWGSVTVAERLDFEIDYEELPKKFFKKSADTAKMRTYYKLEGKTPKGTIPQYKKYLTKRFKKESE